jgi:hypothetical protein
MAPRKLLLPGILLIAGLSGPITTGQTSESKWHVTFAPYSGKELADMPVQVLVFDVKDHGTGMWVREWRIVNRSEKTFVRFRWALFVAKEDDLDSLLLVRELEGSGGRGIGLTLRTGAQWPVGPCSPQAYSCQNAFATPPLDKLLEPLSQQKDTRYRISFGVDKVWFQDGTVWEFNPAHK